MSSYHIVKDGKQAGPIAEETIRQQIAAGALGPSDLCWCAGMTDWQPIGSVFGTAPQASVPPPFHGGTEATPSHAHHLTSFPVAAAILLHYVTFGIFTLVWLNLMHGKMRCVRADDPSAGKAVGFCFIPFFNLYWIFFTYRRLCLRIDEQRELYGLPPGNLRGLATTACIFQVIPYLNFLVAFLITTPIFMGMVQSSVNQLVRTSETTEPRATLPALLPALLPARGMSGGAIAAIVCASLIPVIGLLAAIAIPSFMKARSQAQTMACINTLRILDAAKEQARMEHGWSSSQEMPREEAVQRAVLAYVKGNQLPRCPAGGSYQLNPMDERPACSVPGHVLRL